MNLSIYIKLWIANVFGKVKIERKYKHYGYLIKNNYISPKLDDKANYSPEPGPFIENWYTITNNGKKAMWGKSELMHTKAISWLAL